MAEHVKSTRRYDSPRRREQAAATRRAILEAAQARFERDGYAPTSMAAIARAAGVATKTVYLAFETKPALLRAVWNRCLRGDEEDVPVPMREWYQEVVREPDPARRLRLNARNVTAVRGRIARIREVIRTAAPGEPEIQALWDRIQREFYDNQRKVLEGIDARALRAGRDLDRSADVLYALNDPATYHLLVHDRGWSPEAYERWLGDVLCRELLRASSAPAGRATSARR